MSISILVLGSGGSMGIPVIGCHCPACSSTDPKNNRLRASILIRIGDKSYLVDPGPDFRQCCLIYKIEKIDGVFITHPHEDHIGGMNDVRPFHFLRDGKPIPCFASASTWDGVGVRFHYLLDRFNEKILTGMEGTFSLDGNEFSYFTYSQEGLFVTGFRFGTFAYVTDIKDYEEKIFTSLEGVETMIVSALHEKGSHRQFSLDEAVEFGKRVGCSRVIFTHVNHEMSHAPANAGLPDGMEIAYDGMRLNV